MLTFRALALRRSECRQERPHLYAHAIFISSSGQCFSREPGDLRTTLQITCPAVYLMIANSFGHGRMSFTCLFRSLHGLTMAAPRKVSIVGSGNWLVGSSITIEISLTAGKLLEFTSARLFFVCHRGSVIARIIGANVKDHPDLFQEQVQMYVYEEMVEGKRLTEIINAQHENVKYLPGFKIPENVVRFRFNIQLNSLVRQ